MSNPKLGLITFGDARDHEWKNVFQANTETQHQLAIEYFQSLPLELISNPAVARSKADIDGQVDALKGQGVEAFIVHTPCWTSPNLVVRGVQRMDLPTVIVSNKKPGTHGTVGFLGAAGTLAQIGKPHLRIREDFDGPNRDRIAEKALPFFRAAAAAARLRGEVFGLFGGRSLGIDTGSIDPMQWRAMFGVDVEHIDQLEIIRRSDLISKEDEQTMVNWLTQTAGSVDYNEKLTPEKLAFQARTYLATKELAREHGLDFVAVKCMPDLTNHYVPQCLTAALMPGPFDASGDKEPMAMACEADSDGALTMEILKHVSGGTPTFFGDVSYINPDTGIFYLPNCGGMCAWYAARSNSAAENMGKVELRPTLRPGGGCTTFLTAAPGPVTLARLYRKSGQYFMAIMSGQTIDLPPAEMEEFIKARGKHQLPTAFAQLNLDLDAFIDEFGSNHISGVAGHYVTELVQVCEMLNITPVVMDKQQ